MTEATELHFAAQAGDVDEIQRLVASGVNVNVRDSQGNTPLKYASAEPFPNAIRALLALGASVNLADNNGFTPLHCVASHGFYDKALEMAELLVQAGADLNARSSCLGYVPLHEVRTTGMIDYLLDHGADPSIRNSEGQTPLEYLIQEEENEEAKHLDLRIKETAKG